MRVDDLVLELGTEELPPVSLRILSEALADNLASELQKAGFSFTATRSFATPRRLAVLVEDLTDRQEDRIIERKGPSVSAARDAGGQPTKALLGFARSCGITDLSLLEEQKTEKGHWIVYRATHPGRHLGEVLEDLVLNALDALPIDRRMRWGSNRYEFARPVHWVVLMHGQEIVPARILGCPAGRVTRGHRFMSAGDCTLTEAGDYVKVLEQAKVMVDFDRRRQTILDQVQAEAKTIGGSLELDEFLLEEVTALVEWPVALTGSFDSGFLDIPEEALISAMKKHQRYFHLRSETGDLLPHFITVSNIESKDPAVVISGNEKVITPRLADAVFFFRSDASTSMEDKRSRLGSVVFQSDLGSFLEKTERVSTLSAFIARESGLDPAAQEAAARAGRLCKADLVTDMVNEFPDLQGIMGAYYAASDGEPDRVCLAIREHYLPVVSGGALPSSKISSCVAIADKIDTLAGLFSVGQPPSGSRDPFALRRQALGIIRICIENQLPVDLPACLSRAASHFRNEETAREVLDYVLDRLANWYGDEGISQDVFNAVRYSEAGIRDLHEAHHRIQSLAAFRQDDRMQSLIAVNKRVANILRKSGPPAGRDPVPELFVEEAEASLSEQIDQVRLEFREPDLSYEDRYRRLADLQPSVDRYFDDVMVMADDEDLRQNRLATLARLRHIFLQVADFSLLQT